MNWWQKHFSWHPAVWAVIVFVFLTTTVYLQTSGFSTLNKVRIPDSTNTILGENYGNTIGCVDDQTADGSYKIRTLEKGKVYKFIYCADRSAGADKATVTAQNASGTLFRDYAKTRVNVGSMGFDLTNEKKGIYGLVQMQNLSTQHNFAVPTGSKKEFDSFINAKLDTNEISACLPEGAVEYTTESSPGINGTTLAGRTISACCAGNAMVNVPTSYSCDAGWTLNGANCEKNAAINGVCESLGRCASGTSSGDTGTACGTTRLWSCTGSNGGTTASCSVANGACPINSTKNNPIFIADTKENRYCFREILYSPMGHLIRYKWLYLMLLLVFVSGGVLSQSISRNADGSLFLGCDNYSENATNGTIAPSFWCFHLYKKGSIDEVGRKLDTKPAAKIHGRVYDIASNSTSNTFFLPSKSKSEWLSFICGSGNFANTKAAFLLNGTQYTCANHPCLQKGSDAATCGTVFAVDNPFTVYGSSGYSRYDQPLRASPNGNDIDPAVLTSGGLPSIAKTMNILICDRSAGMQANTAGTACEAACKTADENWIRGIRQKNVPSLKIKNKNV